QADRFVGGPYVAVFIDVPTPGVITQYARECRKLAEIGVAVAVRIDPHPGWRRRIEIGSDSRRPARNRAAPETAGWHRDIAVQTEDQEAMRVLIGGEQVFPF